MSRLRPSRADDSGTNSAAQTSARAPTGTLIQKMLCQPRCWTMTPPIKGPTASARPETPAHMPIAWARSLGSGKVLVRIDRVLGIITAAPMPCRHRAAISQSIDGDSAHAIDPRANRPRPPMNALRRPNMSPSVPPVSSRLAMKST